MGPCSERATLSRPSARLGASAVEVYPAWSHIYLIVYVPALIIAALIAVNSFKFEIIMAANRHEGGPMHHPGRSYQQQRILQVDLDGFTLGFEPDFD